MKTQADYEHDITVRMQALGTYKPEFDMTIRTLADIYWRKDLNRAEWDDVGEGRMVVEYTNKASATNLSKSPYYLNDLQYNEQILKYSKALGLTPGDAYKMGVDFGKDEVDPTAAFNE